MHFRMHVAVARHSVDGISRFLHDDDDCGVIITM